jgi:hypothetical protein
VTRIWIFALAAAVAASAIPGCVPEFQFDDPAPDAGGGGSSGGTQSGECASDDDCSAPESRCDLASLNCVRCLPENDNCGPDLYCSDAFLCEQGCKSDEECHQRHGSTLLTCQAHPDDPVFRACFDCTLDADCGNDYFCAANSECVEGCNSADNCEDGWECCPGAASDEPGTCTFLGIDDRNCGSCGNVCDVPENAMMATCMGRMCGFTCEAFYVNCDGMPENGCEVFTHDDEANCGDCNQPCSGTCVEGVCQP